MSLFRVPCTTCKTMLKVRALEALGKILACPKCGSMVLIEPPPGWQPPEEAAAAPESTAPALSEVTGSDEPVTAVAAPRRLAMRLVVALAAALVCVAAAMLLGVLFAHRASNGDATQVAIQPRANPAPAPVDPPAVPSDETENAVDVADGAPAPDDQAPPTAPADAAVTPEPTARESAAEPAVVQDHDIPQAAEPALPVATELTPFEEENRSSQEVAIEQSLRKKLAARVNGLAFQQTKLESVVDTFAALTGTRIVVDRDAFAEAGRSRGIAIDFSAQDSTLGQALEALCAQQQLSAIPEGNQLRIAPEEFGRLFVGSYNLGDLQAEQQAALPGLIRVVVAPSEWRETGGRGSVVHDEHSLRVVQTKARHHEVAEFLRRLARARQAAQQGDPSDVVFQTRWARLAPVLDKQLTIESAEPLTIAQVVESWSHELPVAIDVAGWEAAGQPLDAKLAAKDRAGTLETLLQPWLEALNAEMVPSNDDRLRFAPRRAAARGYVEFYDLRGRVSDDFTPRMLLERLVLEVAPKSWPSQGGTGAAHFDETAQVLIVRQSAAGQRQIEVWLADLNRPASSQVGQR